MTNELKPCAHCAGKAERIDGTSGVFCFACHIEAGSIAAWNRRAPSEAVAMLRALMDRLDSHFGGPSNDWREQEQARRFLAAQDKEST